MSSEITKEDIQKMIDKSLEPIYKRLDEMQEEIDLIGDIIGRDGDVITGDKR